MKGQLIFSRHNSDPITDRVGTEHVIGIYAQHASARLHKHQVHTKILTAWAMTSYYNQHQYHQPAITVKLSGLISDPVVVTKSAKQLLPQILIGMKYSGAGAVVMDLQTLATQKAFEPFVSAHEAKQIGQIRPEDLRVYLRTTYRF